LAPTAPGENSATIAAPRLDWFGVFQHRVDNAKAKPTVDLIFDGDSITDFWQKQGKEVWNQHYGNLNAMDFGIAGDRTENILWRLDNGQVDGLHPKLIVLLIGTNNLSGANGAQVSSPEQVADGIKADVADYQQRCPNSAILLLGIFPCAESAKSPSRARIKEVNQIISKLDDGKKILYLDIGDKFLQPDGTLTKEIMPDFLHPSPQGYEIWAEAIQPVIDRFFSSAPPG
jgi:lysophospholipase L1-like esterase